MGFPVAYWEEDENGTAIGPCTGVPANLTEYSEACIDHCPMTPRASLSNWTSRIVSDPLVLSSLVSGAVSSKPLDNETSLGVRVRGDLARLHTVIEFESMSLFQSVLGGSRASKGLRSRKCMSLSMCCLVACVEAL
jgi:hypothetical protein